MAASPCTPAPGTGLQIRPVTDEQSLMRPQTAQSCSQTSCQGIQDPHDTALPIPCGKICHPDNPPYNRNKSGPDLRDQ